VTDRARVGAEGRCRSGATTLAPRSCKRARTDSHCIFTDRYPARHSRGTHYSMPTHPTSGSILCRPPPAATRQSMQQPCCVRKQRRPQTLGLPCHHSCQQDQQQVLSSCCKGFKSCALAEHAPPLMQLAGRHLMRREGETSMTAVQTACTQAVNNCWHSAFPVPWLPPRQHILAWRAHVPST
jgi:hypothetical protein